MKIIASKKIKKNIIEGILLVLTKIGYDCYIWDRNIKPFFDMLDEQKPNILFIPPDEEHALSIGQSEKIFKTVFFGLGEPKGKSDLWCIPYPNKKIEQERKSYIFNNYANTIKYAGKIDESPLYSYDLVYFTEDCPIKNKYIIQLLELISSKQNIKLGIFGDNPLPFNEYLGKVSNKDKAALMKNCKIGIDLFGENYMDFALFHKPCITPFNNTIFPPCINIQDIINRIHIYLYNDLDFDRTLYGKKAYENIIAQKLTDCHVTAEIFNKLGYKEIGDKCLGLLNQ